MHISEWFTRRGVPLKQFQLEQITAGEVARMLGISRQAVYWRVNHGKLKPLGQTPEGIYIFSRTEIQRIADDAKEEKANAET